ncbi:hypothetical protein TRIUR3_16355 [Triticum urartu]|uniref:Uncharacterized protein n=1 Tax=Triticum urartu TaxID=4572 RepID=M8A491_TRIUA|nr:hypothetical protein TRIUR3_16355 [Triticum urartu]
MGVGELDAAGTTREPEVQAAASTVGHVAELHDPPIVAATDERYDGPSKPQEEPVVLVSNREPSPDFNEEKLKSKDEKKLKGKKRVGSPMSAGSKYKKIKIDSKTEAMYQYYVMKRYKMKRGEIE